MRAQGCKRAGLLALMVAGGVALYFGALWAAA
jgi:hypothetical protein